MAQETFVKLWQSKLDGAGTRTLTAWVYRTSTRAAIDRLRARSHRAATGEESQLVAFASHAPDAERSADLRQQLKQLSLFLPADELEVALLSRVDGLTYAEIAEVLECSERTVGRCLDRFAKRVEQLREGKVP